MTIAWRAPAPKSDEPDPDALPAAVTGPGGKIFNDCLTVAGVDKNIRLVMFQIAAHAKYPKRVEAHWADLDALLERRHLLTLEAWLAAPSSSL